jgi:hypothetical protein
MRPAHTFIDTQSVPRVRVTFSKFFAFCALLPLMFYPTSPVFYLSGISTYLLSWVLFVATSFLFIPLRIKFNPINKVLMLLVLYIIFHMWKVGPFNYDARMLASASICIILTLFHHEDIRLFMWWLIKFFVAIFFIGAFVKFIMFVGIIDINNWNVASLSYLSEMNPGLKRQNFFFGDAIYSMPFYVTSMQTPFYGGQELFGFGPFVWHRFSFIYAEPMQLVMFIIPLIPSLFLFSDKSPDLRVAFFIVFSVMLFWSFSVAGLLVYCFILIPALMWRHKIKVFNAGIISKANFVFGIFYLALLFTVIFTNLDMLDNLLNINKSSQIQYYLSRSILQNEVSYFGAFLEGVHEAGAIYGWTNVVFKYGLVGASLSIYYYAMCLRTSILSMNDIMGPILILSILPIMVKYPEIISIYFTLIVLFSTSRSGRASF